MRRRFGPRLSAALLAFVAGDTVLAQGNSASMDQPVFQVDVCKRDVLQYQANIELVRKALGDQAATEQAAKFMSKEQWDATLLKQGYCGIARSLREQKLSR